MSQRQQDAVPSLSNRLPCMELWCLVVVLDIDHTDARFLLAQDAIQLIRDLLPGAIGQYDLQSVSLCVHLNPISQSRTIIAA